MINYLLDLGIDENDIKNIMEFNNGLTDYEEYDKNIAKKYFDVKCKITIKRLVMLMINELDK